MRWLEVRRNSLTKKGTARGRGSHLSGDGVALARRVGAEMGPFEHVVTGQLPRTIETAIAMGYAVDGSVDMPSGYVAAEVNHHDQWAWVEPYVTYQQILARGAGLAKAADTLRTLWTKAVEMVPDGGSALVIATGGAIEPTLVACLPGADHATWGAPFSHCDGARLGYRDGGFVDITFRRVTWPGNHTG